MSRSRRLGLSLAVCAAVALALGAGKGWAQKIEDSGGGVLPPAPIEDAASKAKEKDKRHDDRRPGGRGTRRDDRRGGGRGGPAVPIGGGDRKVNGQIDALGLLGIGNPLCDQRGEIQRERVRASCKATGAPEGRYPTSNYALDVNIETSHDNSFLPDTPDLTGTFLSIIATLVNALWTGMLFLLKIVFAVLGWAFSLNPFGDGTGSMGTIQRGTKNLYSALSSPWILTLMVVVGAITAYRGLIQRDVGGAIAGTLGSVALMLVAAWVALAPQQNVGQLARVSNDLALAGISAPKGDTGRPIGSFAESLGTLWDATVTTPFISLNFSDSEWALAEPTADAVEAASSGLCGDVSVLDQAKACAALREQTPKTNADLYLRSSPKSVPRTALWELNYIEGEARSAVAIQGKEGALTRIPLLGVILLGLLGILALLGWLAMRLFIQSSVAVVLVVAAPLALFLPAFGEGGRKAFTNWGQTLIGALIAKVVYAAMLALVILGAAVMRKISDAETLGFLLTSAFYWAVFLKRTELVGWISVSRDGSENTGGVGRLGSLYMATKLGERAIGAVSGGRGGGERNSRGGRARDLAQGAAASLEQGTVDAASEQLGARAEQLANSEYASAAEQAARIPELERQVADVDTHPDLASYETEVERGTPPARAAELHPDGAQLAGRRAELVTEIGRAREAQKRVESADRRQEQTGSRWDEDQLAGYEQKLRRQLGPDSATGGEWRSTPPAGGSSARPPLGGAPLSRDGEEGAPTRRFDGASPTDPRAEGAALSQEAVDRQVASDRRALRAVEASEDSTISRSERYRAQRAFRKDRAKANEFDQLGTDRDGINRRVLKAGRDRRNARRRHAGRTRANRGLTR